MMSTSNRERAAEVLDSWLARPRQMGLGRVAFDVDGPGIGRLRERLIAALDAAEARGRAEMAGKVRDLAREWLRDGSAPTQAIELRALVADSAPADPGRGGEPT